MQCSNSVIESPAEAGVRLLQAVALAMCEAEDLQQALSFVLAEVGRATGWVTGESWLPDATGQGLVGRVWQSARSEWVQDVARDPEFVHTDLARRIGLRTAAAIPVLAKQEVVALLVFYHYHERQEDRQLLGIVSSVASQLGMLIRRQRAEDDLARKAEELARTNSELEQLVWLTSHDLQEPARMVTIYAQMLAQHCSAQLSREDHEILHFITEGAGRMQTLLNDLRMYAEVTRRTLCKAAVDSEQLVERALVTLQPLVEQTYADLRCGPLPVVQANAAELGQVFEQLLQNALTYHEQGTVPRIGITAERIGNEWVFAVRDNGIGVAPEHHERIFGVFQRLHDRNGRSGSGIGLPICRKIVERHGGRIWVESRAGQRSTFRFSLPLAGASPPARPLPRRPDQ